MPLIALMHGLSCLSELGYGARPLPNIASSPWAPDSYPDLASWGVSHTQHAARFDDATFARFEGRGESPFLPTYNLARKGKRGYVIAPKFRRPLYQGSPPSDANGATKFEHIAAIPYFAQVNVSCFLTTNRIYHSIIKYYYG